MKLNLLCIGQRMPAWVSQAYNEYSRRMPREMPVKLIELAAARGSNLSSEQIIQDESARLLKAVPKSSRIVLLDVEGKSWSTEVLAENMEDWRQSGHDWTFIIGGANGVSSELRATADFRWSLSRATFPHPLVRIILIEQLYRAWTIINGHPYHRE